MEDNPRFLKARNWLVLIAIVLTSIDLLSTYIALSTWSDMFMEGNALLAGYIKEVGLLRAVIGMWMHNVLLILLLWYSKITNQLATFVLLVLAFASSCAIVNNLYLIFSLS